MVTIKKIIFFLLIGLICSSMNVSAAFSYSYGIRGKDTLVAVYENVIVLIQENDYEGIRREAEKIEVPFSNFANYYGINLKPIFFQSIEEKDGEQLIITLEQLVYFAIREKIYWNKKEELLKTVAARARLKVISQYYALFKDKIKRHDRKNNTAYRSEIVDLIVEMSATMGSPGIFGYQATAPKLDAFISMSRRLEAIFVIVFPYFEKGLKAEIKPH